MEVPFKPGKTREYSYHFRLYFGFLDGLADKPTLATGSSDPRRVNGRKRGDTIVGLDSFAECTYISVTFTPWNFSLFANSKPVGHFRVPKTFTLKTMEAKCQTFLVKMSFSLH